MAEFISAEDQKRWLLDHHWTEEELKLNQWRPKPWTEEDDRTFDRMNDLVSRDFLKCPNPTCSSVGTFKPRFNPEYQFPRYYCCKWCGYGRTVHGEWQWLPDPKSGWGWKNERSMTTPKQRCADLDPWCG